MTVKLATDAAATAHDDLAAASATGPAQPAPGADKPKTLVVAVPSGLLAAMEENSVLDQVIADAGGLEITYHTGRKQAVVAGTFDALKYVGDYVYELAGLRQDGTYTRDDYPYTARQLYGFANRFPSVRP